MILLGVKDLLGSFCSPRTMATKSQSKKILKKINENEREKEHMHLSIHTSFVCGERKNFGILN